MNVAARLAEAEVVALAAEQGPKISATPYRCRDPRQIPLRPWIYGRQLLRGSLSVIIAPGAVGKTSLVAGTALAMVTGRPLLAKTVWEGPKRVWLWNLEDSGDELARLIEAARLHWGITEESIGGRLFVDSALDGAELCIAKEDNTGFRIIEPIVDAVTEELIARKMDVLAVDPFVSSHAVSENDNGAIDAIAKKWARVAVQANCAIWLIHHTKKLGGAQATAEDSRGASSLTNAARSVIALNRMSPEQAAQWGIEGEDHKRYFRAYDDKANRAPAASTSDWYQLASVDLGNGTEERPGDNLQVVIPWTPPDAFTGITWEHLREVQAKVSVRSYRVSSQADEWVGNAVADVLSLDPGSRGDRTGPDATRIKQLIKTWLKTGALIEDLEKSTNGADRKVVRVGKLAEPESSPL